VVVTDRIAGEIESPQWLAHTVDTLAHRVPTYTRPISVWSRIYDGQEYITIYNPLESAFTRIFIFFTCTGNFVTPVTPFWMELFYAESSLLWGNHQYYEFNPNLL